MKDIENFTTILAGVFGGPVLLGAGCAMTLGGGLWFVSSLRHERKQKNAEIPDAPLQPAPVESRTKSKPSFPSDPSKVGTGGLLAEWSEGKGAYVLSERTDNDSWLSIGYVFTDVDARHIVEGWIAS